MSKLMRFLCCVFCTVILTCTAASLLTVSAASKNTVTTSVSKVESKAKGFKVTWKKKSKIKGYQIQYSTSSKFKKSETQTKTVSKAKTTSATVSKLKGCNKKYYVRVRTYKVVKGKNVYSSWSKAKSVTTLNHKYSSATCTKAKICKYCNKTSGEKLGHKYAAATCTKAKTCTRCKATSGKALGHKYSAATCTKAKTCSVCKATSGKALGHKYAAATCTKAKTCSVCKATSGKARGHSWNDATCTTAKTCINCKATSGEAKGHCYQKGFCIGCNAKISEENLTYISITKDNWEEYFEINRRNIIPEKNAFGEYGTPEDMYYVLEMNLKEKYREKLVSIDVSIELVRDTYLQSYDYDVTTGIATITNEYKKPYNNTDKSLCNFKSDIPAYVCACHIADSTVIEGKTVYYGYICESTECVRAAGTIVIQNI